MSTSKTVAIIDYGSGNLHSAAKAFERMNRQTNAGYSIKVPHVNWASYQLHINKCSISIIKVSCNSNHLKHC